MADSLKILETVIFDQQTPPQAFRLMDIELNKIPVNYNHGKITIPAETEDFQVATQVNICILRCALSTFTLKVGNITNPEMTCVNLFNYSGSKEDIFVSNPLTESIIIDTVVASI